MASNKVGTHINGHPLRAVFIKPPRVITRSRVGQRIVRRRGVHVGRSIVGAQLVAPRPGAGRQTRRGHAYLELYKTYYLTPPILAFDEKRENVGLPTFYQQPGILA